MRSPWQGPKSRKAACRHRSPAPVRSCASWGEEERSGKPAVLRSQALDEASVPFFGAFGTAWDEAMVAPLECQPARDAVAGEGCRNHERGRRSSSLEAKARADSSRELRSAPQDLSIYRSKMLCHMKRVSGRANALQR